MSIQDIYHAVLNLKPLLVTEEVIKEIEQGTEVSTIIKDGLVAALDVIGKKFTDGEIFVPEMILAAKGVKAGMEIIHPIIAKGQGSYSGTIIIGSVKGDLHDIGKNLVAMMLEGVGFKVIDLGVDVKKELFLETAKKHNAQIIALSALLTTTMSSMQETVAFIKKQQPNIGILIGGAPVDHAFCDSIFADAYADDAAAAVIAARHLVNKRS